jgi:hypothetical protein
MLRMRATSPRLTIPARQTLRNVSSGWAQAALLCVLLWLGAAPALAQGLKQGSYFWYVPEHESYSKTKFYSEPRFDTSVVRIARTQRFRLVAGRRGWFMVEFDVAGRAYIHMRVLYNLVYDPGAADPWHEFQRASVFAEEPAKIEARLKAAALATAVPQPADSSVPSWKRYKDGWNVRGSRAAAPVAADPDNPNAAAVTPRAPEKKPRSKYPLLPPIGSEPQPEEGSPAGASGDAGTAAETAR